MWRNLYHPTRAPKTQCRLVPVCRTLDQTFELSADGVVFAWLQAWPPLVSNLSKTKSFKRPLHRVSSGLIPSGYIWLVPSVPASAEVPRQVDGLAMPVHGGATRPPSARVPQTSSICEVDITNISLNWCSKELSVN